MFQVMCPQRSRHTIIVSFVVYVITTVKWLLTVPLKRILGQSLTENNPISSHGQPARFGILSSQSSWFESTMNKVYSQKIKHLVRCILTVISFKAVRYKAVIEIAQMKRDRNLFIYLLSLFSYIIIIHRWFSLKEICVNVKS